MRDYAFFTDMVKHRQSMAHHTCLLWDSRPDLEDCTMMPYFDLSSVMGLMITLCLDLQATMM